jgi:arylsulfatase A-like enzyme
MKKPNIVEIICHDLGRHLNCYGWNSVKTPNLDALAATGVRFTNAFCTSPSCTPSRSSIATGRYPHQNGLMGLCHDGWNFNSDEVILTDLLKKAGYQTMLFGTQHVVKRTEPEIRRVLNYDIINTESSDCDKVADKFIAWIGNDLRSLAEDNPFFASIGFHQPHRPHNKGKFTEDKITAVKIPPYLPDLPGVRKDLAGYEGLIEDVDRHVGRILDALKKTEILEDTIVIFTTDHGSAYPRAKMSLYDPGVETALIIYWKGRVEGGKVFNELINNVDMFPTVLELANVVPPKNEGRSFLPLLLGERYEQSKEIYFERNWHGDYDPMRAVRTKDFKLVRNFKPGFPLKVPYEFIDNVGKGNVEKYFAVPRPEYELYDLKRDPNEFNNLYACPDYCEIRKSLEGKLDVFLRATDDPILKGDIPCPSQKPLKWVWYNDGGRFLLKDFLPDKGA